MVVTNPSVVYAFIRRLPADLKEQIESFNMEGFGKKNFSTHKRGFFRRRVPMSSMLTWTKDAIPSPILSTLSKEAAKEAVSAWKVLQRAMGDRSGTKLKSTAAVYQPLVELGINNGALRDELYVQLVKQLNQNPHVYALLLLTETICQFWTVLRETICHFWTILTLLYSSQSPFFPSESTYVGWEILAVYSVCFPPSKNFENYLATFVNTAVTSSDARIKTYAEACQKRLKRIARVGPRGKMPSLSEIERAAEGPMSPSLFGEPLDDIMRIQNRDFPSALQIPRILPFLADAVTKLNGQKSEGIFRYRF